MFQVSHVSLFLVCPGVFLVGWVFVWGFHLVGWLVVFFLFSFHRFFSVGFVFLKPKINILDPEIYLFYFKSPW